ncbi:hypothetical protein, partial [Alkalihalobacillus sp. TS-13]|uniref:hypothetical protein n=1 Tax=Alkalihalobacillus sp. TS-13 TaxID=2842455 RepID=UPI001C88984A
VSSERHFLELLASRNLTVIDVNKIDALQFDVLFSRISLSSFQRTDPPLFFQATRKHYTALSTECQ